MYDPYETIIERSNERIEGAKRPRLLCAVVTFLSIPVWFAGLITAVSAATPLDNPAGIQVYMMLCLVASIFVAPINTYVIAPIPTALSSPSYARSMLVHAIAGAAVFAILWSRPWIISQISSLGWTIIPFYLCIFLLPPMRIGSTAFPCVTT